MVRKRNHFLCLLSSLARSHLDLLSDILLGGGDSEDNIDGGDGHDVAAGDCVSIIFDSDYFLESITSTRTESGKTDLLRMGEGDDIAIAGGSDDEIHGGSHRDILVSLASMWYMCVYSQFSNFLSLELNTSLEIQARSYSIQLYWIGQTSLLTLATSGTSLV